MTPNRLATLAAAFVAACGSSPPDTGEAPPFPEAGAPDVVTIDASPDVGVLKPGDAGRDSPNDAATDASGDTGGGVSTTLKYFGYWRDSDLQNYVCQVEDHANYSMTTTGDPAFGNGLDAKHALETTYGISDWGVVGPASLGGYIVQDDADAGHWTAAMWASDKTMLEGQVASIKGMYPNAHLMIDLDGTFEQVPGFALPVGYDWFGIECYGRLGNQAADCKARFDALKPLLPANGKVWIFMPAETGYGTETELVQTAQAIYQWALTEPLIIGLMGFVWQSEIVPPDTAVRDLPNLKATFRQIGSAITGRKLPPGTNCPPP